MNRLLSTLLGLAWLIVGASAALAQNIDTTPRPTPLTRPQMKELLEEVKHRTPRIPLPELTADDRQVLGEQADSYESRIRYHYLNGIEVPRPINNITSSTAAGRAVRSRQQDPNFTLDNGFKIELFWIVSRVNNCHYCIGHQESKLLGAGRSEDEIAALDGDWADQPEENQVAFRFARRFTYEPHLLTDSDIQALQRHYTDEQILEMVLSMSGNNSINRWKEALAVPQSADEGGYSRMASYGGNATSDPALPRGSYLTPTSPKYASLLSLAVPVNGEVDKAQRLVETTTNRPNFESKQVVLENLRNAVTRETRLPLLSLKATREALPNSLAFGETMPNWVRLLAHFPTAGAARLESILAAENGGDLSPLLKAQLSWIVARQDRAWYAAGQAMRRLRDLGIEQSDVFALDGDWKNFPKRERALFQLARHLSASPVVLTSAHVAEAVEHAGPRDTVQAISYVCSRASFNRLTESAGLPLEEN